MQRRGCVQYVHCIVLRSLHLSDRCEPRQKRAAANTRLNMLTQGAKEIIFWYDTSPG